jgi:hypothetical protein
MSFCRKKNNWIKERKPCYTESGRRGFFTPFRLPKLLALLKEEFIVDT